MREICGKYTEFIYEMRSKALKSTHSAHFHLILGHSFHSLENYCSGMVLTPRAGSKLLHYNDFSLDLTNRCFQLSGFSLWTTSVG